MRAAYIFVVAGILYSVPFSDMDLRWKFAECDPGGAKRAEERDKTEGIREVEELHGSKIVIAGWVSLGR